jgi:beta-lactamase superfamily II metal-dependent hydrolase
MMEWEKIINNVLEFFDIIVFPLLWILGPLANGSLDMRMFKVSQANFVPLTCGNAALVVDCGGLNKDSLYVGEIESALENVTKVGGMITHNQRDHDNGVERFLKLLA